MSFFFLWVLFLPPAFGAGPLSWLCSHLFIEGWVPSALYTCFRTCLSSHPHVLGHACPSRLICWGWSVSVFLLSGQVPFLIACFWARLPPDFGTGSLLSFLIGGAGSRWSYRLFKEGRFPSLFPPASFILWGLKSLFQLFKEGMEFPLIIIQNSLKIWNYYDSGINFYI